MQTINFTYSQERHAYVAELTALSDLAIHLELEKAEQVRMYRTSVEGSEYSYCGVLGNYQYNLDIETPPTKVFPKFYRLETTSPVKVAIVTSGYATDDLEELRAEVERQKLINEEQQQQIDHNTEVNNTQQTQIDTEQESMTDEDVQGAWNSVFNK